MTKVLFICTGNICRSPTAEGVFRSFVAREGLEHHITVHSAGTHDYHVGDAPDRRSQAAAKARGYSLSAGRARHLTVQDCEEYDYLVVMDSPNHQHVQALCPPAQRHKLKRLLEYAPQHGQDVPDPYYGGASGFEQVLDMVEEACEALLASIRQDLPA